jgi:hypothetical protein
MNKHLSEQDAKDLLAEALLIGDSINRMMAILLDADPSESKDMFIESIGLITGHNADVIQRIRILYPYLHPLFDELRK